jgi:uncharacterized protein (TIGR03435 family)
MMRRMLAERLGVKLRMDTMSARVSVLRLAKANALGRGLRPFTGGCSALPFGAVRSDPGLDELYRNGCLITITQDGRVRGTTETMGLFASMLSMIAGRPIVDETGLSGRVQIEMTFATESLRVGVPSLSNAPSFVDAIRKELGIEMSTQQRPVRALFVEHVGELVEN